MGPKGHPWGQAVSFRRLPFCGWNKAGCAKLSSQRKSRCWESRAAGHPKSLSQPEAVCRGLARRGKEPLCAAAAPPASRLTRALRTQGAKLRGVSSEAAERQSHACYRDLQRLETAYESLCVLCFSGRHCFEPRLSSRNGRAALACGVGFRSRCNLYSPHSVVNSAQHDRPLIYEIS